MQEQDLRIRGCVHHWLHRIAPLVFSWRCVSASVVRAFLRSLQRMILWRRRLHSYQQCPLIFMQDRFGRILQDCGGRSCSLSYLYRPAGLGVIWSSSRRHLKLVAVYSFISCSSKRCGNTLIFSSSKMELILFVADSSSEHYRYQGNVLNSSNCMVEA